LNPGQATGRLTLGIHRRQVGAGGDEQFRHLAAVVLMYGIHDQRRHAVELGIRLPVAAVDVRPATQEHANGGGAARLKADSLFEGNATAPSRSGPFARACSEFAAIEGYGGPCQARMPAHGRRLDSSAFARQDKMRAGSGTVV